jgi:hypothetical protein
MVQNQIPNRDQAWQPTLSSLFALRQVLFSHPQPDELMRQATDSVAQATESSRASLMPMDEDGEHLTVRAAFGPGAAVRKPSWLGLRLRGWRRESSGMLTWFRKWKG